MSCWLLGVLVHQWLRRSWRLVCCWGWTRRKMSRQESAAFLSTILRCWPWELGLACLLARRLPLAWRERSSAQRPHVTLRVVGMD